MADFGGWIPGLLQQIGAPATPENVKALTAWQRAEGGSASFNPLNTTQPFQGSSDYNTSAHVKNYPSAQAGLAATKQTLLNGHYANIVELLRSGKATAAQLGTAVAQSPWGTGSGVLRVLGSQPTNLGSAGPVSKVTAPSLGTGGTGNAQQALAAMMLQQSSQTASGQPDSSSLLAMAMARQQMQAAQQVYGASPSPQPGAAASPQPLQGLKLGVPVAGLTSKSSEHATEGLAGFPAYDYFAPSGSAAVAPITGKVVRLSGHDPKLGPIQGPHGPLGWSVYIQGTDGHEYYLTHMGSRSVQVGQTVKAGQPIGTVANYAQYGTPSHIHMGVH